jgi:hypothetical protein
MRSASYMLAAFIVLLVCLWPPGDDRSLAVRLVNWAVDPRGELPVLPPPFALGAGDDPDAVAEHDAQVLAYDARFAQGGWMRQRLQLKVARDPFDAAAERQVLLALGIVAGFLLWRTSREPRH